MRFAPDSPLPDPYDGLVAQGHGPLEVHECMGCVLQTGGLPWGLLTLDAEIDLRSVADSSSLICLSFHAKLG